MGEKEQRIRQRAHEIWEGEGRPQGREEEHWRQAVSEIEAQETAEPAAETKTPKKQAGARKATPRAGTGGSGVSSGLQPSGTSPGGGPGASRGSIGTGGGSSGPSGNVKKRRSGKSS